MLIDFEHSIIVPMSNSAFNFQVVNYEVIHYPQHHDHHVEHVEHVHAPSSSGWDHSSYGRKLSASEMAYNAYKI